MSANRPNPQRYSLFFRIVRGEGVPISLPGGYALSLAIVGLALGLRFALLPADSPVMFVTFYPAVALAAMLFGAGPGLAAVAFSVVCAAWFIMPPGSLMHNLTGNATALAIFTLSGSMIGFLAYQMRRNAELSRASSERFYLLASSAFEGIAITEEGRIVDCNEQLLRMLGYARAELIGMRVEDAIPIADRGAVMANIQAARESHFEHSMLRKDGGTILVEAHGQTNRSGGRAVRITALHDITERKHSQQALVAREEQWRTLVENSPNTIARYDRSGRRIYVNPAFARMVEGGAAALVGKTPAEFPGGLNSALYETKIQEVFATGEGTDFELNWKDTEGKDICSHIRLAAEFDAPGNVVTVMGVGSDITELNAQRELIHQMAFYDQLTDLPNRRLLQDRLQQALATTGRTGQHGALLFIDLDDFKSLNDTLGHTTGDVLLQQVATRLKASLRADDSIARMGGDEFVVIVDGLSAQLIEAAQQTEAVSNKIFAALNRPYRLGFHEYHCTASMGATLFRGHDQAKAELIKQADIAMYQAKRSGRSNLRFFDPKMQDAINVQAALEGELRQALERRQFHLHYQVQVDRANRAFGAEALIRWIHPVRGMVSPAQFIPLAESTDLILPIGQWVLETACAQLKAWENDALARKLSLSVNVSAKQFHRKTFVDSVRDTVQRHAINPAQLTLELTESLLLEHIEDTITTMSALRNLGVRFSLDDFGTGYSSLQYLKRLPLNQLKIDQSFMRDIAVDGSDLAIVQTIIAMAQSLNLGVIAEGVETEEQRRLLLSKGCEQYQGYLFGRPVAVSQFDEAMKASQLAGSGAP